MTGVIILMLSWDLGSDAHDCQRTHTGRARKAEFGCKRRGCLAGRGDDDDDGGCEIPVSGCPGAVAEGVDR